jgi:hypothetical protein
MTEKEFIQLRSQYEVLKRELSFNNETEKRIHNNEPIKIGNIIIEPKHRLYDVIKNAVIDFGWQIQNNDIQILLGNKKERQITFNQNRFMAQICQNGELLTEFYHGQCDNSHSALAKLLCTNNASKIVGNNTPMFGAFYSLICGNGYGPELIIYGESCDYPHSRLTEQQILQYKDALSNYCHINNYRLTFNII